MVFQMLPIYQLTILNAKISRCSYKWDELPSRPVEQLASWDSHLLCISILDLLQFSLTFFCLLLFLIFLALIIRQLLKKGYINSKHACLKMSFSTLVLDSQFGYIEKSKMKQILPQSFEVFDAQLLSNFYLLLNIKYHSYS